MLKGKKIILGIIGSTAACKACYIIRELIKQGAEVQVVVTPAGKEFTIPVTFPALTSKPVISESFTQRDGTWNSHVGLGLWADAVLIVPATVSIIGKIANGTAGNVLTITYLPAKAPVSITPAVDLDMFAHPAAQKGLDILRSYGNHIIEPEVGELASHLVEKGHIEEPENIIRVLDESFASSDGLPGKKVTITARLIYEKIDPVCFIGNYSSGKMGLALAEECARRGAQMTLMTSPVQFKTRHSRTWRVDVEPAEKMYAASQIYFSDADTGTLCAATADYRPETVVDKKTKREKEEELIPHLQATQDITADLGALKGKNQLLVGFALETNSEQQNVGGKLEYKNLDLIVLNSLNDAGAGFRHDASKISIIDREGRTDCSPKPKTEVAQDIIDRLVATLSPGF